MSDLTLDGFVNYVLRDTDSLHVVVGPLLRHKADGTRYFIIAASERGRGFRCDQVIGSENDRQAVIAALTKRRPLVIHIMDCEIAMRRLCEVLWPGDHISRLRKEVEVELLH